MNKLVHYRGKLKCRSVDVGEVVAREGEAGIGS
jgi:hypothetical protein